MWLFWAKEHLAGGNDNCETYMSSRCERPAPNYPAPNFLVMDTAAEGYPSIITQDKFVKGGSSEERFFWFDVG